MPKPFTFPTLYNDVLQLSIADLKRLGYLKLHLLTSGTINWSTNGRQTGSISILVNTQKHNPYIELDYKYRGEARNYKLQLDSLPSNLGKGSVWYFRCPHTNKLCRKLYSVDGYFLHREAFKNCMYETQTYSKKDRRLMRWIEPMFKQDKYNDAMNAKYFKRYYAGKPTKRYLKVLSELKKADSLPRNAMEMALMK